MIKLQPDISRQFLVTSIFVLVCVAAVSYLGWSWWQHRHATPSNVAEVRETRAAVPSQETARYQQVLDQYNNRNADAALKREGTYVSVPSTRDVNSPAVPPAPAQASSPASSAAPSPRPQDSAQQLPPQPQQQDAVDADRLKQLEDQVKALAENWAASTHGEAAVTQDGKTYVASLQPPALAAESTSQQQQRAAAAEQLIPGYELVAAELATAIDTDEQSWVSATIPAGPYAGAEVFAPGYKRLENTVDMTFTGMKWRGRSYKINAKAVDAQSLRTALSGEVNNRYFSRIVLPAIAAGIGRVGQLFERSGTTTVISPLGGAVITAPDSVSGRQITGAVIGGAAQQGAAVIGRDAAAMPVKQVLIPAQTTIGVRFLAPVFASDEVRGDAAAPAPAAAGPAAGPWPTPAGVQQWQPAVAPTATPLGAPTAPQLPPPGFTPPYVPAPYAPGP